MQIYITGPAWSGKSTLAKRLGERFGVPVTHLDELLWNADWTENEAYADLQKAAISQPEWIIEWPSCSIVTSMPDVDRIVILDYPPMGNVVRMLLRRLKSFLGKERAGMALPDRLDFGLIVKAFTWRKRQLPRLREKIKESGLEGRVLAFGSPEMVFDGVCHAVSHLP